MLDVGRVVGVDGVGVGVGIRLGFFEQCEDRWPKRETLSAARHQVQGLG